MEVWGAQGGDDGVEAYGGRGGYARGEISLQENQEVYVFVGGSGVLRNHNNFTESGGYNGGGAGGKTSYGSSNPGSYGGGGATDIRINGTSITDRVIVAGGGGGTALSSQWLGGGGGGGGYRGGSGGTGATQVSGTANGIGTEGRKGTGSYQSGAWYFYQGGFGGGTTAGTATGDSYNAGGGGGSSYIGNLKNSITISGGQEMPNPAGGEEQTGNSGNGYARITFLH